LIKLGDLGLSTIIKRSSLSRAARVGTPAYLAPELVKH